MRRSINDEDFNPDGTLKDKHSMRVPLRMADSATVRDRLSALHDSSAYRPGFRNSTTTTGLSDAEMKAADTRLDHALKLRSFQDRHAWRGPEFWQSPECDALFDSEVGDDPDEDTPDDGSRNDPETGFGERGARGPQEGDACTVREGRGKYGPEGAAGVWVDIPNVGLTCVGSRSAGGARPSSDAALSDAKRQAYQDYDRRISSAWKG